VQSQSGLVKIKEKETRSGLRLLLSFEHVDSVKQALRVLERF